MLAKFYVMFNLNQNNMIEKQLINNIALILAAGVSNRLPGKLPKQYLDVGGRSLLRMTIDAFRCHPNINNVKVVINKNHQDLYKNTVKDLKILPPTLGGDTRQKSVKLGLDSIEEINPSHVLIHDGARPLVSSEIINRVLEKLHVANGVIPVLPVNDTIKKGINEASPSPIDRSDLWRIQTPQGFNFRMILDAHRSNELVEITDDSILFEKFGKSCTPITGSEENIKITNQNDLIWLKRILSSNKLLKVATGYDVHRLGAGKGIRLSGITIPSEKSLIATSDGDVVLHAITDAILGALSAGDIGHYFPPDDETWKNVDSTVFLEKSLEIMRARQGYISHIDVTIVCEEPRISPYRKEMIDRLSSLLDISLDCVSIKATTTDGLGLSFKAQGIGAIATVSISIADIHPQL